MSGVKSLTLALISLILFIIFTHPALSFYLALSIGYYGNHMAIVFVLAFAWFMVKWMRSVQKRIREKYDNT